MRVYVSMRGYGRTPLLADVFLQSLINPTITGYGLPIARNYARQFGGDIQIDNSYGKGCSVRVTLSQLGETKEPFV